MAELAYKTETEWLWAALNGGCCDVFFPTEVDEQLGDLKWSRPEVIGFLKTNPITFSERGESGWVQYVEGVDCDDRHMRVVIEVESNVCSIEVIEISEG